jgi:phage regulator Rha-like protein
MFQLNADEFRHLKSQIVTSSWSGIRRAAPYAFTEQGVEMLSSVLNSKRAILVNIAIIRAFVRLREILAGHQELAQRFKELEEQVGQNTAGIETVSRIIQRLLEPPPERPKKPIGLQTE